MIIFCGPIKWYYIWPPKQFLPSIGDYGCSWQNPFLSFVLVLQSTTFNSSENPLSLEVMPPVVFPFTNFRFVDFNGDAWPSSFIFICHDIINYHVLAKRVPIPSCKRTKSTLSIHISKIVKPKSLNIQNRMINFIFLFSWF